MKRSCPQFGASPDPGAVGGRRLAVVPLERPREVERIREAHPVGDLARRQVAEAKQPGGLHHHPVRDELLRGTPGRARERPRQYGGGHRQRVGVVRGVVMTGVIRLEPRDEAAQELNVRLVRLVRRVLLAALRVVPALDPEQDHGDELALKLDALRIARPAHLGAERLDHRVEALRLLGGHRNRPPALAGQQPARHDALLRPAEQLLLAEAHDRAVHVLGAFEDVHLAASDQRDGPGARRHAAAIDQVVPAARPHPDQLVVVVPMRLARLGRAGRDPLQRQHVHHLGRIGHAVERELAVQSIRPRSHGVNESYCACLTAEMSRLSLTRSETRTFPLPSAWLNVMPQSPRPSWPVTSSPTRSLPQGSLSVPWTSAFSVIGRVTPRIVSSPSISKVSSSTGRIALDTNDSSGCASAWKKSSERRWLSRWSSFVYTDAVWTVPYARAEPRSSPISRVPSNSLNLPRTVAIPRCFTENSTLE